MNDNAKQAQGALTVDVRADGVAIVGLDVPGAAQNTLIEGLREAFEETFARLAADDAVRAIVVASRKRGSFIAGADIRMLEALTSAAEAGRSSRLGQAAFDAIEQSKKVIVAAIDGACLGGGLELALACHARVASTDRKTKLGLPEVQLGLLPGAGGTQRIVERVGLEAGLDLLLTGKQLDGKKAKKLGLVDEVVPSPIVVDVAAKLALALAETHAKQPAGLADKLRAMVTELADDVADPRALRELALAHNPAGRRLVFDRAEKMLEDKAGRSYPAPYRILEVVRVGLEKGRRAGLDAEARAFGELAMTEVSKRLIEIFFATTELKKDNGTARPDVRPRPVTKLGVIGGGIMGHGIAFVTATQAHLPVRLRERDVASVGRALGAVRALVDERVRKKKLSAREAEAVLSTVTGTTDGSGLRGAEVVIEAVFEDLALKHAVLKQTLEAAGEDVIFASNTSSLPIAQIAAGSPRPDRVVGMHYFSPVHKMPLLEVIRTKDTADEVVATVVDLGKKQGKTVIVVHDGVGFYTSRILAPYMNEASWMIAEGYAIEDVDRAARLFGFPVGPITLLDEVGIDTAEKVSHIMFDAFGERMTPPPGLEKLIADGRTGRKGQKGFYRYEGGKKTEVDTTIYKVLGIEPNRAKKVDHAALGERLGLAMVAEAIRCLGEGILRSPRDGDVGAIFGLGFPPFRGGPFRYADAIGAKALHDRIRALADVHGRRFAPPELLGDRARSGHPFHA